MTDPKPDGLLVLPVSEIADLLQRANTGITLDMINEDIDQGAPASGGHMDLVAYAAWLISGETSSTTSD